MLAVLNVLIFSNSPSVFAKATPRQVGPSLYHKRGMTYCYFIFYFFLLFLCSFSLEYLSFFLQKEKDTPTQASAVQAAVYPVKFSLLNISTRDEFNAFFPFFQQQKKPRQKSGLLVLYGLLHQDHFLS